MKGVLDIPPELSEMQAWVLSGLGEVVDEIERALASQVPTVAELYAAPLARLDGALLAIGWLGVAIGIFAGRGDLVRAAAVAVAAGAVLEAIIIARVARRRVA